MAGKFHRRETRRSGVLLLFYRINLLSVRWLTQAYNSLQQRLKNAQLSDEGVQGLYAALDHITHHPGQAVLHLRINRIVPPEY